MWTSIAGHRAGLLLVRVCSRDQMLTLRNIDLYICMMVQALGKDHSSLVQHAGIQNVPSSIPIPSVKGSQVEVDGRDGGPERLDSHC